MICYAFYTKMKDPYDQHDALKAELDQSLRRLDKIVRVRIILDLSHILLHISLLVEPWNAVK